MSKNKVLSKRIIMQHCKKLTLLNSQFADLFYEIGPLDFVPKSCELYEALIRSITSQMISTAAASTITKKLIRRAYALTDDSVETPTVFPPLQLLALLSHDDLRTVGYSNNKSLAIAEIVAKSISGELQTIAVLESMTDSDIIKLLVPLRGIGQWSVEMFLIFTLGRANVWPVDDYGVREGFRCWHGDAEQTKPKQLQLWADPYRPYRSVLALYLWRWADRKKNK